MPKITEMSGVTGGEDGFSVEVWLDDDSREIVVRAYNEAGCNCVDINFAELRDWMLDPTNIKLLARWSTKSNS